MDAAYSPSRHSSLHRSAMGTSTINNTSYNPGHPPPVDFDGDNNSLPGTQQHQGRFIEEWDNSQRGSSIIDGNHSSMQRSASIHSYNPGDDQNLPSRHNTLKKKSSLRRGNSLRPSSSRRSMRAGSVKSLALQSATDPDEARSAFHCPVPTSGNPTEGLSNRFQCKSLPCDTYAPETAEANTSRKPGGKS